MHILYALKHCTTAEQVITLRGCDHEHASLWSKIGPWSLPLIKSEVA